MTETRHEVYYVYNLCRRRKTVSRQKFYIGTPTHIPMRTTYQEVSQVKGQRLWSNRGIYYHVTCRSCIEKYRDTLLGKPYKNPVERETE